MFDPRNFLPETETLKWFDSSAIVEFEKEIIGSSSARKY